ncbi:MAG TPA: rod shape-determining protein MreD, partial [Streptosporangiaceae bacterium]|nr:rod shape-determining protein MreD [Streptosporangiaceae bacterium]
MKRKVAAVSALAALLLVQLTVVNGVALPGGGTPDLVLLCAVALGLTGGPAAGLVAGFCAGLALDLAPPASQLAGQYALVLCLAGYGSGRLRFTLRHSAAAAIAAAAAMAALGEALAAVITLTLDTPEVTWATVAQVLPASVLYDLALGPFVLLCWVRAAVALGASFDPRDDSPALETGGSAAPQTVPSGAAGPGRPRPRQAGQRLAIGGDSRAAASGRWLVGDIAEAAPAVGAIGWLAGPVRSRRARREQARLTAMVTGASQRKGAFWVGRRPPGLVPVMPPGPARPGRLVRLRPGSGVAGTAATPPRPAPQLLPGPVRLGLADEQRRRSRTAARAARVHGRARSGREPHGVDAHGVNGPGLPSIGFGTGISPGAGRAAGRDVPQIAFGTGARAGTGRAGGAGRAGGVGGAGRPGGVGRAGRVGGAGRLGGHGAAPGRRVPRIAFGTGGVAGSGRTAGHQSARARAAGRRVPRITFGGPSAAPPQRARASRAGLARLGAGGLRQAAPRFASGAWPAGSAVGRAGLGSPAGQRGPMASSRTRRQVIPAGWRPGRKAGQLRFAPSAAGHQVARTRQPKAARMSAGRRSFRRLPWLRRGGDRSTVWRVGSRRAGGYR